ncbi:MAG: DUF3833 domain-containing protein [Bacteriovorax sp.]|nr:DUF3833 domain-containing protein [Bacteriovorax sp.]
MKLLVFIFLLILISCSNHSASKYQNEVPKINLSEFFNGKIEGLGIVQNRSGKVIKRFNVDILASWNGNKGTLDEKFVYSDNTKSTRVWQLNEISANIYEGSAGDVLGVALGETAGNTFYFRYNLDLPVGNSSYKVHFEDWMYLLDKNTLLARSYMTKWGINLGEVTIVLTKKGNK